MSSCAFSIYKSLLFLALFSFAVHAYSQVSDSLSKKKYVVDSICIVGNKKTRHFIILREMNFHAGDSLSELELRARSLRCQQNLMNTSLFVFDTVYYKVDTATQKVKVLVSVKERWYFWPNIILMVQDRNFNAWWYQEHGDLARLNYGIGLNMYNIFGANQSLSFIFRRGYTEQYGAGYRIPYINKKKTIGLVASYYFYRNNQVWYRTVDNALAYYTDKLQYVRQESESKMGMTYRHKLYFRNSLELFYKTSSVLDTVARLNADYFSQQRTSINYFSVQYRMSYDVRDYKPYALKGFLAELFIEKDGLNVLQGEGPDNLFFFGGVRHHFKICNRLYMINSVKGRYMAQYVPMYYFNRALGFSELVRGYEYYVVDGQSYGLLKSNLRFQVIRPRAFRIPIAFLREFTTVGYSLYAGPFLDAGYVRDDYFAKYNPLSNQWLVGYGFGIDLVTYYDMVFRTEFSMNKMGQPGIYLHLNAPL